MTSIGDTTFGNCYALTYIDIPNSVTSIDRHAFFNCTNLSAINVSEDNKNYISENGVLFDKNKETLVKYPQGKKDKEYVVLNIAKNIEISAFSKCNYLTSVIISDSVKHIGAFAFEDCSSLVSVNISDNITSIGNNAFDRCTSLALVNIPDSVKIICSYAFNGCYSLTSINISENTSNYMSENGVIFDKNKTTIICYIHNNKDTEYVIPDNIISIGTNAFYKCSNLESVTMPDSVTSIGKLAFYDCTKLESIKILNPECEITDDSNTISYTATIYGYAGSTVQAYAEKYGRTFVALD